MSLLPAFANPPTYTPLPQEAHRFDVKMVEPDAPAEQMVIESRISKCIAAYHHLSRWCPVNAQNIGFALIIIELTCVGSVLYAHRRDAAYYMDTSSGRLTSLFLVSGLTAMILNIFERRSRGTAWQHLQNPLGVLVSGLVGLVFSYILVG